jgi:hypothetical protein
MLSVRKMWEEGVPQQWAARASGSKRYTVSISMHECFLSL